MTRYELLDIRAALDKASNWAHNQKDLFQMIDAKKLIEKELSQPSLPSDLDEAAKKIADEIVPDYPDISWDTCYEKIVKGIKAGAEWDVQRILSILESRLSEIMGDAQPKPVLRAEIRELIEKIKEESK